MLLSFRPRHSRPNCLAKQALTCLQTRYSKFAPGNFRYLIPKTVRERLQKRQRDGPIRTSLQRVTSFSANDILTKSLEQQQTTLQNMETYLTECINQPEVNDGHSVLDLDRVSRWIVRVERDTHTLMGARRQYMALCATQILLNTAWNHPCLPGPGTLSLRILEVMLPFQRREISWHEARAILIQPIIIMQRYNISERSLSHPNQPKGREGQQPEDQMREPRALPPAPQTSLRRVQALIQATDYLFLEALHLLTIRKLTRVIDEVVLVIKRLEMMGDRMWLELHLGAAHEYLLLLQAEVNAITEPLTPPLISLNTTQLESTMKLYDLYSSISKPRSQPY